MKKQPRWVPKRAVLAIHEMLQAEHGGVAGVLDEALLDSALASPIHHFAYDRADIVHLAAVYARALTQDHPVADGNKRVALTVAGVFLELNGFRLDASEPDAAQAMWALSARRIDEAGFAAWLRTCTSKLRAAGSPRTRSQAAKPRGARKKK